LRIVQLKSTAQSARSFHSVLPLWKRARTNNRRLWTYTCHWRV